MQDGVPVGPEIAQQRPDLIRRFAADAFGVDGKPGGALRGEDVVVMQIAMQDDSLRGLGEKLRKQRFRLLHEPERKRADPASEMGAQLL